MQSAVKRFNYGQMARNLFPSHARKGVIWLDTNTRVELYPMGGCATSTIEITLKDEGRRVYADVWSKESVPQPVATTFRAGQWIKALLEFGSN